MAMSSSPAIQSQTEKDSITPSWYNLQTTSSGQPYIALPASTPSSPSTPLPTTYLTPFQPHDTLAMQAILSLPEVNNKLCKVPKPYHLHHAEYWIGFQLHDGEITPGHALSLQAIRSTHPQMGELIGAASLTPCGPLISENGEAKIYELGYYLHPAAQGQGVMRNAVLAALSWAVAEKGVREVVVNVEVGNWRSRRLVESLEGFVGEGEEVTEWPEEKGGGKRSIARWVWRVRGRDGGMGVL